MALRLHDSLTRQLKELRRPDPNDPKDVFRFYNCGPTVYAPAHIGNFRTFVVNDVLRRLLELEFGKDKVKHVRNVTDVDDKTIKRARDEGRPLSDVTKQWTDKFHADCRALNCLDPHVEPTATGHLAEQVNMIEVLLQKGHAYRTADGSVYFRIMSYKDYGLLSHIELQPRTIAKDYTGADEYDRDSAADFALWKAWKPEDGPNQWPGPAGAAPGRPGWHIECSAMSKKHLGETIDLHSGGVDLLFPHHENEIAQSQCCNGVQFSRHWYHSEHLLVDGKKMSKSLGNLYTLDDLTAKGYSPMAVRYALLMGHPRKQLDFTLKSLHDAESALEKLQKAARALLAHGSTTEEGFSDYWLGFQQSYPALAGPGRWAFADESWDSLFNDLNFPSALGFLFKTLDRSDFSARAKDQLKPEVANMSRLMFAFGFRLFGENTAVVVPDLIKTLAENRWAAKKAKDFATADALRKELAAAGWAMLDGKDGYKLEPIKQ